LCIIFIRGAQTSQFIAFSSQLISAILLNSVFMKFSMLPLVRGLFARGRHKILACFCAIFGAFSLYLHFALFHQCLYAAYSVFEEILNASFSSRFIRQGALLDFGVFFARFSCSNLVPTQNPNFVLASRKSVSCSFPSKIGLKHTLQQ